MDAEYDVVVIGAGAAGIAAGRVLRERGAKYCLLEAKPRLGGRAWTDTETFSGLPLDRGCHWLHCASRNPLLAYADANGFAYDSTFSFRDKEFSSAGRRLNSSDATAVDKAVDAALCRIEDAGARGFDVSAESVLEDDRSASWYPVFTHILGLITSAMPHELSAVDYARGEETGEDYPVHDGLGALICRLGEGLRVHLSTPVSDINWSGRDIHVFTDKGELRARSVIITVSTSVLNARNVRFTPPLPTDTAEAISNCTLGCYEKVAFLLNCPFDEYRNDTYITVFDAASSQSVPVSLYIGPSGQPIVIAELAGPYLSDLVAEGSRALIDAATQAMVGTFGNDIRERILLPTSTSWTTDEHILGAYSYARAGCASDRLVLSVPIDDRLFIAGEAVSIDAYATCHGAYQSGIEAATKALESIGA